MFESLSEKLQKSFRNLTGKGKISEENVQSALKEIRLALLEADVNFKVVKKFVNEVKEEALGQEVTRGLDPGQMLIKIVNEKLIEILGGSSPELNFKGSGPHIIMMVGLQGSGKTTSCGKLAKRLAAEGRHPFLVPCDVARPAAILQLQTVGKQVDIPVFDSHGIGKPLDIVKKATVEARNTGRDVLIIDTAGRLHIDEALMGELKSLRAFLEPSEILFVADAMTGQDAVTSARSFHEAMDITGVVLSKMDGDARGGAALSIKSVTERPIKFIGTGEGMEGFERFHPDRVASRILGMGDVLSLIEKVQEKVDQEEAQRLQEKMLKNQFTLEDFSKSISQIGKLGDMGSLMGMVPGMGALKEKMDVQAESKQMGRFQAMINSMTPEERRNHAILNQKRKQRIARGSGTSVQDINGMLNQFMQMRKMMGMMGKPGKLGKLKSMLSKTGLGDFADAMMPGPQAGVPQLPPDMDIEELQKIAAQNGGKLPPQILEQLGMGAPSGGMGGAKRPSRPKKDRKKEKAKRKKGRKRR
ncbi:MAG: signal recognition particle protein [Acidobacteriota bacterium]|nr:signal recognition particle protein [Acidobacteriota bacterium]